MTTTTIKVPNMKGLEFEEHRHIYKLNGIAIPSVTTIMKPLSNSLYKGVDEAVLNMAAARGTAVHNAIENYTIFGIADLAPEYQGYMDAYIAWNEEYSPKPIASECQVYHKILRYAGTSDMIAVIGKKLVLIDFKTSSSVNKMLTGVQLEAYAKAYESHGLKVDGKAILHLKRNGKYEWVFYESNDSESWEVFGALLMVFNHIEKYRK